LNPLYTIGAHVLIAVAIIAAAVVLAVTGHIAGSAAVGLIGTAGGFSLGTAGASSSIAAAASAVGQPSSSSSTTATPTQQNPTGGQ
jgi:hypothetical protein